MHKLIKFLVPSLLAISFIGAVAWLVSAPEFEPALTSLALLTSLIAIYTDRWVDNRERRRELLRVLAHELYMNLGVIKDLNALKKPENISRKHVYSRFYTTSLTTVIASGMFTDQQDKKLWKHMNAWLQQATDFNNRLSTTEAIVLQNPKAIEEFNVKIIESKAAKTAIAEFEKLLDIVMVEYKMESDIDYNTVLFEEE